MSAAGQLWRRGSDTSRKVAGYYSIAWLVATIPSLAQEWLLAVLPLSELKAVPPHRRESNSHIPRRALFHLSYGGFVIFKICELTLLRLSYSQTTRAGSRHALCFFDDVPGRLQRRKVAQSRATGVSLLPPGYGKVSMCREFFMSILTRFFEKQIFLKPL